MELENELMEYFTKKYHATDLTPETGLITMGTIDSFGILELITHIEKNYQIRIEAEDMDFNHFQSIKAVADLIRRKRS